jgi:hypothetical protein
MPEVSDSDFRALVAYQGLGTVQEISKKITDLEKDNKAQRDEITGLKTKLPKENEVVVPKERAETLEKFEALGKPEELQAVVTERDQLRTKDQQRTREDAFRGAVRTVGWPEDTVATLLDMRSLEGAKIEVRKAKNGRGEEEDTAFVTLAGENQKEQLLTEFAAATPQLKGLKLEGDRQSDTSTRIYPKQSGDSTAPKTEKTADDQRKATESTASYSL